MRKDFYLESKIDALPLHVLVREPKGEIKGIVQICHGMMEHKERYENFMEMLVSKGYVAIIHDHRGHGKSVRSRKDLGYFYDDTGEAIVEDAFMISQWAKKEYPDVPLHLFGHSMGSLIVRCYLKKHDDMIDSLIVCGSPSKNPAAKVAVVIAELICKVADRKPGKVFHKIVFDMYRKVMGNKGSANSWISYNEENVKAYEKHELDGFMFTYNGFLNTFKLMTETYNPSGWAVRNPELPVLFIAGKDDPCITSRKQYAKAIKSLKEMGYPHVRGVLFHHMRHEILNEHGVEKVYGKVIEFLEESESL